MSESIALVAGEGRRETIHDVVMRMAGQQDIEIPDNVIVIGEEPIRPTLLSVDEVNSIFATSGTGKIPLSEVMHRRMASIDAKPGKRAIALAIRDAKQIMRDRFYAEHPEYVSKWT